MSIKRSNKNFYLEFPEATNKYDSAKAKCFDDGAGTRIWIPKSQILHESRGDGVIKLTVPEWFVIKENLQDYIDQDWLNSGCPD